MKLSHTHFTKLNATKSKWQIQKSGWFFWTNNWYYWLKAYYMPSSNNPKRKRTLFLFYRRQGSEELSHSFKFTQLVRGGSGIWMLVSVILNSMHLIAKPEIGNMLHTVWQLYAMGMTTWGAGLRRPLRLSVGARQDGGSGQLAALGERSLSCQGLPALLPYLFPLLVFCEFNMCGKETQGQS